jgi:hypothetical protein
MTDPIKHVVLLMAAWGLMSCLNDLFGNNQLSASLRTGPGALRLLMKPTYRVGLLHRYLGAVVVLSLCVMGGYQLKAAQPSGPTIETSVKEALKSHAKVKVIIILRDASASSPNQDERLAEMATLQETVLRRLMPADFTLSSRWKTVSGLSGWISTSGLEKLSTDQNVLRIGLTKGGGGSLAPH